MEQEIQYCTSADGTRIAFSVVGSGPGVPLIYLQQPPFSSVTEPWRSIGLTEQELATLWQKRAVCFVNPRGCGLSDRDATDFDLERLTDDLEAVVERTGWSQFSLFGMGMTGPVAILYASRHPDLVSRLILRDTYLRAADMGKIPRMRALGAVLRADFETYLDLMTLITVGWDGAKEAEELIEWMSENGSHEAVIALANATASYNVTGLAEQITVPTLVLNPSFMAVPSTDMARAMVAMISDARLTLYGRRELALTTEKMAEFLAEGDDAADASDLPSGTSIILFADIANSTGLTEELGDARFREKARALDETLRDAISSAGGIAIEGKLLGDGVLATFGAAHEAIACARVCHDAGDGVGLQLHVGIHAGDVIREDNNVFGGAVNVAARISDASAAGETLVSGTVRDLARTSAGASFEDKGERDLKGVSDPVRVWAVL
jgi:class 3 adenylate cyclase